MGHALVFAVASWGGSRREIWSIKDRSSDRRQTLPRLVWSKATLLVHAESILQRSVSGEKRLSLRVVDEGPTSGEDWRVGVNFASRLKECTRA